MAITLNGTTQYISLGNAVNVYQTRPFTVAAVVDTTSLRTTGNYGGIYNQGNYTTTGWSFEIEAAASPRLYLAFSNGGASPDCFSTLTLTPNTGLWFVAAVVRWTGAANVVDFYAYRYNTSTLTITAAKVFATNNVTNADPGTPTGTQVTGLAVNFSTALIDWFPGNFGWVGIWAGDLGSSGTAGGTSAINELIQRGGTGLLDSNCKGLWQLTDSAIDRSAGAHNGTLINSPAYAATIFPGETFPMGPILVERTQAAVASVILDAGGPASDSAGGQSISQAGLSSTQLGSTEPDSRGVPILASPTLVTPSGLLVPDTLAVQQILFPQAFSGSGDIETSLSGKSTISGVNLVSPVGNPTDEKEGTSQFSGIVPSVGKGSSPIEIQGTQATSLTAQTTSNIGQAPQDTQGNQVLVGVISAGTNSGLPTGETSGSQVISKVGSLANSGQSPTDSSGSQVLSNPLSLASQGASTAESYGAQVLTNPTSFPTTPSIDSFTRSDGPLGGFWIDGFFTLHPLEIVSNQVTTNISNVSSDYYNVIYGPDTELYYTVTGGAGTPFYLFWRITNPSTPGSTSGYYIKWGGTGNPVDIRRLDSGTDILLTSFTQALSNGDSIGVSMVGSTITVYYQPSGGSWASIGSTTDSTHTGAGSLAIGLASVAGTLDNFGGGTIGGGATYPLVGKGPVENTSSSAQQQVSQTYAFTSQGDNTQASLSTQQISTPNQLASQGDRTVTGLGVQQVQLVATPSVMLGQGSQTGETEGVQSLTRIPLTSTSSSNPASDSLGGQVLLQVSPNLVNQGASPSDSSGLQVVTTTSSTSAIGGVGAPSSEFSGAQQASQLVSVAEIGVVNVELTGTQNLSGITTFSSTGFDSSTASGKQSLSSPSILTPQGLETPQPLGTQSTTQQSSLVGNGQPSTEYEGAQSTLITSPLGTPPGAPSSEFSGTQNLSSTIPASLILGQGSPSNDSQGSQGISSPPLTGNSKGISSDQIYGTQNFSISFNLSGSGKSDLLDIGAQVFSGKASLNPQGVSSDINLGKSSVLFVGPSITGTGFLEDSQSGLQILQTAFRILTGKYTSSRITSSNSASSSVKSRTGSSVTSSLGTASSVSSKTNSKITSSGSNSSEV